MSYKIWVTKFELQKGLVPPRDHEVFFWMKTLFRVEKLSFFCGKYFSFWMPLQNPISFLGVYRFSEYKDDFSFVYIPVNSQEMPSNTMSRAASATARGIFSWGAPRRKGLWRLWPGEEKHLQLAQLHQDGGHPAGKVLLPIHQPQLVKHCIYLMYLFQIQIVWLWFGLAGSSHSSRSCSETSWSLDLTSPFPCCLDEKTILIKGGTFFLITKFWSKSLGIGSNMSISKCFEHNSIKKSIFTLKLSRMGQMVGTYVDRILK